MSELLQQGPVVCVCVCVVLCPRASHTHSAKTTAEIPQGSGEVGVSHVLINASLIPLSQYRKPRKCLKSTDKGHHRRQQERVGEVRGPRGDSEIERMGSGEIKRERGFAYHSQHCCGRQRIGLSIS